MFAGFVAEISLFIIKKMRPPSDKNTADGTGDAADSIPGAVTEYAGTATGKRHQQLFH